MLESSHLPDSGWFQCTSDPPTPGENRQKSKRKSGFIRNQSISILEMKKRKKAFFCVLQGVRVIFFSLRFCFFLNRDGFWCITVWGVHCRDPLRYHPQCTLLKPPPARDAGPSLRRDPRPPGASRGRPCQRQAHQDQVLRAAQHRVSAAS